MGPAVLTPSYAAKELKWQADVAGDDAKANIFKAQVLGMTTLRVFTAMIKKSGTLKLFHSVVEYNDPFTEPELSGTTLASLGDRTERQNPPIVGIPPLKPWQ